MVKRRADLGLVDNLRVKKGLSESTRDSTKMKNEWYSYKFSDFLKGKIINMVLGESIKLSLS